jgi:hypothetical protein
MDVAASRIISFPTCPLWDRFAFSFRYIRGIHRKARGGGQEAEREDVNDEEDLRVPGPQVCQRDGKESSRLTKPLVRRR